MQRLQACREEPRIAIKERRTFVGAQEFGQFWKCDLRHNTEDTGHAAYDIKCSCLMIRMKSSTDANIQGGKCVVDALTHLKLNMPQTKPNSASVSMHMEDAASMECIAQTAAW